MGDVTYAYPNNTLSQTACAHIPAFTAESWLPPQKPLFFKVQPETKTEVSLFQSLQP